VSLYGDDVLTDPEYKAFVRSSRGGGSGPVGGGGSFAPLGGGGGGGALASLNMTTGGNDGALRALLRRRLRPPGASGGPSYMAPATGQPSALDAVLGGGKVTGGMDTSGLSTSPTMTAFGRMPQRAGGGGPVRPNTPTPAINPAINPPAPAAPWDPNDPNSAPSSPWANGDNGFLQNLITILGRFNATGAFTPNGSSAVNNAVRSNAVGDAQAMLQRNKLAAQSLGTDPATAASYALQSDLRGQSDVSNAVNRSALEQLLGQQKFGQDLLSSYMRGVWGNKGGSGGGGGMDTGDYLAAAGKIAAMFL
jgi:hypothetical protein